MRAAVIVDLDDGAEARLIVPQRIEALRVTAVTANPRMSENERIGPASAAARDCGGGGPVKRAGTPIL